MQGLPILLFLLVLGCPSIWSSPSEAFQIDPRGIEIGSRYRWWIGGVLNRPWYKFPGEGILPSPIKTDPAIRVCWAPFQSIHGCSFSLLSSSRSDKIDINADCCAAALGLTPDCFYKIFYTLPFKGNFGPSVKTYCASKSYQGNAPATDKIN